jgi:hypothetical protein
MFLIHSQPLLLGLLEKSARFFFKPEPINQVLRASPKGGGLSTLPAAFLLTLRNHLLYFALR